MNNIKRNEIKYPYLTKPVVVYERENGHKIVCAYKEGGLCNVSTWIKTGSINEDDKINGISHFLEHLMFKGTPKHPAGEFDKTLEAKGGIVNAATWKDYTFYYVTLPAGENLSNFYECLELHADMMLNPLLPEFEIGPVFDLNSTEVKQKRERHVVIEEIKMRKDQPWTKLYNNLNFNMYTSHPYKRDVIGTPKIIAEVEQQTIMNYYKNHYTPNKMTTIVVGDFEADDVIEKIVKEFDFKDRKNSEINYFEQDLPTHETKTIRANAHIETGFLMFGFLCPKANVLKDNIALEIISIVLGDGQSSRLNQNLIEKIKNPIFNMINTEFYQFRDGGNFFIQANFKPQFEQKAIDEIKAELKNIVENKITQKEFKKAIKKLRSNFAADSETVSDIADTIGFYTTVCYDLKLIEEYCNILNHITIDDIFEIANKYLKLENAVVSILMPEGK